MRELMNQKHYDILILGGGEAGKYLAWTMAKLGKRTAVIERQYLGGSCPNVACLPSKNLIYSAHVAALTRRHQEFGISTGPISLDMGHVQKRKQGMVQGLLALHADRFDSSGAELIWGEGRFSGDRKIRVALNDGGELTLTGERVFLNLGSRAAIPDIPGLRGSNPMTHVEALNLSEVPEHLVILGGGYVGVEFAQAFRRLGSRVTLIARGSQLLSREDPDVALAVLALLEDEGVSVRLNCDVTAVEGRSGQAVEVNISSGGIRETVTGTAILAALGRTPNTSGIGLEDAGIEVTSSGHVRVNERLETSASQVWAMGECAGSPYFTHASYDDFRVVRDNLNGHQRSTSERTIPYCVFTDPPLARVGMNEREAQALAVDYRIATMPIASVLRTRTISEPRGFMKALVEAATGRILGFAAFGAESTELMSAMQVAILAGLPYTRLTDAVFAHPTMSEGLSFLFDAPLRVPAPMDSDGPGGF
jgi:pyruvate/2-oxoglutarate dehydrogenase complex dihydrolipoamide dehydrogenase (E3) component